MARYYFHTRDGWDWNPDEEGMELPSWDAAEAEARASTIDLLHEGCSRVCSVEVADQSGQVLARFKIPLAA